MSSLIVLWGQFVVCSALIWVGGTRLLKHGETIARLTGVSTTWIGMILLATATSIPELVSGVTAVTVANAPNVALGDVLGSCIFNLTMISVLDAFQRPNSVFSLADRGHVLGAGFSMLTLAVIGAAMLPGDVLGAVGRVGLEAPLLVLLYAAAMREAFRYQKSNTHGPNTDLRQPSATLGQAATRYAMAAVVVIAAASWLPFIGTGIAHEMGWTESFVGTLLIALTTSLPELTVTVAAVRMGAVDMAIGNLVGSNLFNMVVLAVDTTMYLPGRLLASVASVHAVTVFVAMAMTSAVMIALIAPPRAKRLNAMSWTGAALILLFFANTWIHFRR